MLDVIPLKEHLNDTVLCEADAWIVNVEKDVYTLKVIIDPDYYELTGRPQMNSEFNTRAILCDIALCLGSHGYRCEYIDAGIETPENQYNTCVVKVRIFE